jgi:hypothetical protein
MDIGHSRRSVIKRIAAAGVAAVSASAGNRAAGGQIGVDSGGVGLRREDFEAAYGIGVAVGPIERHANVVAGVPGATVYAQYMGEVVAHLEVRWQDATPTGSVDWQTAYEASRFLMPADAVYLDQFWLPATPEGPVEIVGHLYESAQLNEAHHGFGRLLVLFQRIGGDTGAAGPLIPAVTITKAAIGQ